MVQQEWRPNSALKTRVCNALSGACVADEWVPATSAGMTTSGKCACLCHMWDDKIYTVYILANKPYGTLYIGVTGDLLSRITQHREGVMEGFTKKYGVHRLVWFENFGDVTQAIQREKTMKKWRRQWKINTIEETNPHWEDLYPQFFKAGPKLF
jgi:putative endonuclease